MSTTDVAGGLVHDAEGSVHTGRLAESTFPAAPAEPPPAAPESNDPRANRLAQLPRFPGWLREVDGTLAVASQFVLAGNIHDKHLVPDPARGERQRPTLDALWQCLQLSDYEALVVYDPVDRLRILPLDERSQNAGLNALGLSALPRDVSLTRLAELIGHTVTGGRRRVAVAVDYASRIVGDPSHLADEERAFFTTLEKLSHVAEPVHVRGARAVRLYNPVLWLVGSEADLPSSLTARNEAVRTVPIPVPGLEERSRLAALLVPTLPGTGQAEETDLGRCQTAFAEQSSGMTLRAMEEIQRLAIDRQVPHSDIEDAVRCYRVGMLENPWKTPLLRRRIRTGLEHLTSRVLGQDRAARKSRDILIRSTMGLTSAHTSSHVAKPRGILFFAGPTGVGKTELAKAITQLVFGDERAYTRFDMSEFAAEHTDARLIGAPPGYTGHDSGGELTNAVRERPFSLILFDEIEKAHPKILDKFLQILEDGRLTDGSGGTVHFSETVIVFTSNLGIYTEQPDGSRTLNVSPDMPRSELECKITASIHDHFTLRLNRPELLNRIGDNVVVFDFITPEVGAGLVQLFLSNIQRRVAKELDVTLNIAPDVSALLRETVTADLRFGGRGIGSVLESAFVNPLARALFEHAVPPGATVTVTGLHPIDSEWEVELA